MDYNLKVATFVVGCIILISLILITVVRWRDMKGSVFVNNASYSKTEGHIVSSKTENRSGRYGGMRDYVIAYEYRVNGTRYVSSGVTFTHTGGSCDNGFAEHYIQKYPVGKSVTVYYTADNPSFSALEPSAKDSALIIVCVLLFLTPIFLIWSLVSLVTENIFFG